MNQEWNALKAFQLGPTLFRDYARWKKNTRPTIIRRQPLHLDGEVVGVMVFYRTPARAV
jgi:hypothetical protein